MAVGRAMALGRVLGRALARRRCAEDLRIEAAQRGRVGDALDRDEVGGGPHVDLLPLATSRAISSNARTMISRSFALTTSSLQWSRLRSCTHSK